MTTAIKIWFCAAVAMIAAAIADPLVESASNAGWFGPGNFTDHSTWDVVPAFLVGLFFVALYLWLRVRTALDAHRDSHDWPRIASDALGPNVVRLVPAILAAQMAILYLMETIEQRVIYGHVLGGLLWLGAPIAISIMSHAAMAVVVVIVSAKVLQTLAQATIHAWNAIRAHAQPRARIAQPAFLRIQDFNVPSRSAGILRRNAERAPPILAA
jgi:hypothetical protein